MLKAGVCAALALLLATASAATVDVPLNFKTLLKTSTQLGSYKWGQILNHKRQPVYEVDENGAKTNKLLVSNNPDFGSILEVTVKGQKKLFLMTQFESPRPGTQWMVELTQKANGELVPQSMQYVDWAAHGGLWIPCAGSRTPWMSHLAGEEYEPDARPLWEAKTLAGLKEAMPDWSDVESFMRYWGVYPNQITMANLKARFNPYRYGHIVETKVGADGKPQVHKHYTLGRAAWEMAMVMPDRRTVYGTDDGSNVGFFKFVADKAGDLSSGKLYAAKMKQLGAANGGTFSVSWILLGKGNNAMLKAMGETMSFNDIFATAPYDAAKGCPAGFTSVNQDDVGAECLRVRWAKETAAAFLETRRYAAMKGATVEWSKWEGITFDSKRKVLYTAMSGIREGMEDNRVKGEADTERDAGGPNHIRLPYNKCGCIYTLTLDAKYSVNGMQALTCGTPIDNDANNACALDGIASPDNVHYSAELDSLLINEDTSYHQNNVMWAMNLSTRKMARVLSVPYGAETTGAYAYSNIRGWSYILSSYQHPYDGLEELAASPLSSGMDAKTGYFAWKTAAVKVKSATFKSIPVATTEKDKHSMRGTTKVTLNV